jgi:hypothetical protein
MATDLIVAVTQQSRSVLLILSSNLERGVGLIREVSKQVESREGIDSAECDDSILHRDSFSYRPAYLMISHLSECSGK